MATTKIVTELFYYVCLSTLYMDFETGDKVLRTLGEAAGVAGF